MQPNTELLKTLPPLDPQDLNPHLMCFLADSAQFLTGKREELQRKITRAELLLNRIEIAVELLKARTSAIDSCPDKPTNHDDPNPVQ